MFLMWAVCLQSCGKAKPRGKTSFRRKAYIGKKKKIKKSCSLGTGNGRWRRGAKGSRARWGMGEMQGPTVLFTMLEHFHTLCWHIYQVRWLLPRSHTRKGHYSEGWKEGTSLLSKQGKVPIPSWAHCPKSHRELAAELGSKPQAARRLVQCLNRRLVLSFYW